MITLRGRERLSTALTAAATTIESNLLTPPMIATCSASG
jgi:hypothetical protein